MALRTASRGAVGQQCAPLDVYHLMPRSQVRRDARVQLALCPSVQLELCPRAAYVRRTESARMCKVHACAACAKEALWERPHGAEGGKRKKKHPGHTSAKASNAIRSASGSGSFSFRCTLGCSLDVWRERLKPNHLAKEVRDSGARSCHMKCSAAAPMVAADKASHPP